MADVCDHSCSELPDGVQLADNEFKIQRLQFEEQYSKDHSARCFDSIGVVPEMARCACYIHPLHCLIFGVQKQNSMTFNVQVKVMPLKELLDPQGKAIAGGLQNLGLNNIEDVRVGKNITLQINAGSSGEAKQIAEEATKKLLANPVMEYYEVSVN